MPKLRRFQNTNGALWKVFEVLPGPSLAVSSDLDDGWLCFERDDDVRRLIPIPPNWETASESALADMLARAKPVRNRDVNE